MYGEDKDPEWGPMDHLDRHLTLLLFGQNVVHYGREGQRGHVNQWTICIRVGSLWESKCGYFRTGMQRSGWRYSTIVSPLYLSGQLPTGESPSHFHIFLQRA